MPPIPAKAVTAKTIVPLKSLPAGWEIYTVKDGDEGFWRIAQKKYGHGKHWPIIAAANKSLRAKRLPPGQKVIIPPLPTKSKVRRTATVKTPAPLKKGETRYVVGKGDAKGFSGIAKSKYGDASLRWAIAAANPGVDSSRLQIGHTLIIPPISSIRRPSRSKETGPARRTHVIASDDRPVFD